MKTCLRRQIADFLCLFIKTRGLSLQAQVALHCKQGLNALLVCQFVTCQIIMSDWETLVVKCRLEN